jgi:hypothetical protein
MQELGITAPSGDPLPGCHLACLYRSTLPTDFLQWRSRCCFRLGKRSISLLARNV